MQQTSPAPQKAAHVTTATTPVIPITSPAQVQADPRVIAAYLGTPSEEAVA